ncbi:MAG: RNA degradosome polyphosphate kinase, partial [Proteobacteria bacterium]
LHFMPVTMHLGGFWAIYSQSGDSIDAKHPELKYPVQVPRMPPLFELKGSALFDAIKERDTLLHHPYESFEAFVRFLTEACTDKQVLSIEVTFYRVDAFSTILRELKKAAKHKSVRVVIELRARFDELNNLKIAEELRAAGCEVHFGFGKLKLHAKLSLITRRENDGTLMHYTHLSTGNYNATTAKIYTDLALVTTNRAIGSDARKFFDAVYRERVPSNFKALVPAPIRMHRRLLELIRKEADAARRGEKARIVAKVNALVDERVVSELYEASKAGVKIDLIVRGACSLIPGIQGLSQNIRVISVVDRFLEHSRLYYFGSAQALYLSSADWMPRNFFSRLELAYPILDPKLFEWIEKVLIPVYL